MSTFAKCSIQKATFELKTKLPGSNDRFHSGSGVQELKRKMTDIEKVINSSKGSSSAMFTKLLKKKRKTNKTKKATTKEKYSAWSFNFDLSF